MKLIQQALGKFIQLYGMTTSVRFCLLYRYLNGILSTSIGTLFQRKIACCHSRCHDVTNSRKVV